MGIGMGMTFSRAMSLATSEVEHEDAGVASALVSTGQQVGGSIGTALLNTLAASAAASYAAAHGKSAAVLVNASIHGYVTAFWWRLRFFAIGAVICGLLLTSEVSMTSGGRRGAPVVNTVSEDVAYAAGVTATHPTSDSELASSIDPATHADPASRVVRKDVARNRALLIAAADEVFTERGADATLDDIARHAGVGVATAYRHFENKQALLGAMFEDRLSKIEQMMLDADALPDPRESFEAFVYGIAALQAHDRGTREVMRTDHGIDKVSAIRQRVQPIALRIVSRAQAAGILRPELEPNDIPMVLWMTGAISDYTGPVSSDLWRRYLDFMLDGMLAESLPGARSPSRRSTRRSWRPRCTTGTPTAELSRTPAVPPTVTTPAVPTQIVRTYCPQGATSAQDC